MSDFEWGYRYQRINKSNGREGRLFRTPVPTLSAARELVREYSDDSGRWEVAVIWREPGTAEWHDYEPGGVPGGEVDPQVLSDLLSLTSAGVIPPAVIATWTTAERERAATWAAAEDLHASGHTEIARVPQPSVVAEAAELAANPAMAQLAVEGWTSVLENVERSGRAIPPEMGMALGAARRAITGLLVLTEAEEKRGACQDGRPAGGETWARRRARAGPRRARTRGAGGGNRLNTSINTAFIDKLLLRRTASPSRTHRAGGSGERRDPGIQGVPDLVGLVHARQRAVQPP